VIYLDPADSGFYFASLRLICVTLLSNVHNCHERKDGRPREKTRAPRCSTLALFTITISLIDFPACASIHLAVFSQEISRGRGARANRCENRRDDRARRVGHRVEIRCGKNEVSPTFVDKETTTRSPLSASWHRTCVRVSLRAPLPEDWQSTRGHMCLRSRITRARARGSLGPRPSAASLFFSSPLTKRSGHLQRVWSHSRPAGFPTGTFQVPARHPRGSRRRESPSESPSPRQEDTP